MKSKKFRWVLAIVVILAIISFSLFSAGVFSEEKEPIYIAITVLGDDTDAHRAGTFHTISSVELLLAEVNAEGGINGHLLEPLIKVDNGNPAKARGVAQEVVDEGKAMIVLGHYYSDAARVAGQVYQEAHIPAMTSGATAPSVTEGNEWFFRVLNDNVSQAQYIAQYAYAILGYRSAAVVYEDNIYGTSLRDAFIETFEEHGGEIVYKNAIDATSATLAEASKDIANYAEMPDMIFLATYKASGVAMLESIRSRSRSVAIIGSDAIGDTAFGEQFLAYSDHPTYLDGVYAASALIFDVASEDAQKFGAKYFETYQEEPTWFSATTYDSALIAVKAMRAAGISGDPAQLEEDRQKVRDYLDGIDSYQNAVEGITGNIYFDDNNNFVQPMTMGVFQSQKFVSAPIQLTATNSKAKTREALDGLIAGNIVELGSEYVYKTQIVYVGIDINEFKNLDIDGGNTYFADFYLWFRYQGELDFNEITFDNSVDEISLNEPLDEKTLYGNTHYRLYHIKDVFTNNFDLSDYPFDKQKLSISLRHSKLERNNLIFVVDLLGLGDVTTSSTILKSLDQTNAFRSINDWNPIRGTYYADSIHEYTTRGNPASFGKKVDIERSRFNVEIEIERDYIRFVSKTMLPIMSILVLSYLGLFLPNREFETITSILTGTVLSVVFFHVDLSGRLNVGYTVAMDYAFYAIYGLLAVELFLSIIAWHKTTKNNNGISIKYLFWFMRALYPIVFGVGTMLIIQIYGLS